MKMQIILKLLRNFK